MSGRARRAVLAALALGLATVASSARAAEPESGAATASDVSAASVAGGATGSAAPLAAAAGEPDTFPTPMLEPVLRICAALVVFCALAGGLAYWARRRTGGSGDDTRIVVLATRGLTAKHQLALVEVAGHRLLIGTGGDAIATLADLTEVDFSRDLHARLPEHETHDLVDTIGRFEGLDA